MKTSILIVTLLLGSVLAGCNTMQGLGEDLQALGRAIKGEAAEEKEY